MAASSSNIAAFSTNENTSPNPADPFWPSTPRTVPDSSELIMSVRQVVLPAPQASTRRPTRMSTQAAPRPQCTHMIMTRLYGQHTCHACRRVPEIGFVYSCQQDRLLQDNTLVPHMETLPVVADGDDYFEAQAKVAESIGMSRSIVKQMRGGEYDFDQIEMLLQQRRNVLEVIRRTENAPALNSKTPSPCKDSSKHASSDEVIIASAGNGAPPVLPVAATTAGLPMSPAGTPSNTPVISAMGTPASQAKPATTTACTFQACHSCRPFLTDRLHTNVDAIYNNEVLAITEADSSNVRVLDANLVSNFGLRPSPLKPVFGTAQCDEDIASMAHMHQRDGGEDTSSDISPDWTPTDTTASNDSRFPSETQQLHQCPGRDLCPAWSGREGCTYYNKFDDGKRETGHTLYTDDPFDLEPLEMAYSRSRHARVPNTSLSGGRPSAGSSRSLPEPRLEPLTPTSPYDSPFGIDLQNRLNNVGNAATVSSLINNHNDSGDALNVPCLNTKQSNSSLGSEVEVDGGVA